MTSRRYCNYTRVVRLLGLLVALLALHVRAEIPRAGPGTNSHRLPAEDEPAVNSGSLPPAQNRNRFDEYVGAPGRPYSLVPVGAGLTLDPPGASATLSVRADAYPPTVRLLTTVGIEQGLTPLGGLYGSLRYELDRGAAKSAATYSVQAGVWPYDPHRSGRTAASGFMGGMQVSSSRQPLRTEGRLELGLLSVGAAPLRLDARGEFAVSEGLADRWGYGLEGWRAGLAGVWSATGAAPSPGLWADGNLTGSLGGLPLELGVRGGYRPAWPVPLPGGAFGVLGGVGTRVSVPARAVFGGGLLRLERVTLEPRLRGFVQTSPEQLAALTPGLGADLSLSLDAVANQGQRVAVGGTVGYAGGFWYRLNLRVQP